MKTCDRCGLLIGETAHDSPLVCIDQLRRELASAWRDVERMDWMQREADITNDGYDAMVVVEIAKGHRRSSFETTFASNVRRDLDAAIAATEDEQDEVYWGAI